MTTILKNQQRDPIIPFFLLTFLITWELGALAIFLPAQFQALVGELMETSPIYFLAIAWSLPSWKHNQIPSTR